MLPKPTTHILPPVGTGDKPLLLDLHRLTREESTIDHLIEYASDDHLGNHGNLDVREIA